MGIGQKNHADHGGKETPDHRPFIKAPWLAWMKWNSP